MSETLKMSASIRVGNNSSLGFDTVKVERTVGCAFVDIVIPASQQFAPKEFGAVVPVELDAYQLRDFLLRTDAPLEAKLVLGKNYNYADAS